MTPSLRVTWLGHGAEGLSVNVFHREESGKNNFKREMLTLEVRNPDSVFCKGKP